MLGKTCSGSRNYFGNNACKILPKLIRLNVLQTAPCKIPAAELVIIKPIIKIGCCNFASRSAGFESPAQVIGVVRWLELDFESGFNLGIMLIAKAQIVQ